MRKIGLFILVFMLLILSGCGSKDDPEAIESDDPSETIETSSSTNDGPPYALVPMDADAIDPYPLTHIPYVGDDKLRVADDSILGPNDLNLFVQNLKRAINEKDATTFLSFVHPDTPMIRSQLSDVWATLEPLMVFGCAKVSEDHYVIPYMAHTLNTGPYNSAAIAEPLNMRKDPSIQGDVLGILYYDLLTYMATSSETYVIDGIPYNWIQIQKSDGTVGYASDKYLYHAHSPSIALKWVEGYWYITFDQGDSSL